MKLLKKIFVSASAFSLIVILTSCGDQVKGKNTNYAPLQIEENQKINENNDDLDGGKIIVVNGATSIQLGNWYNNQEGVDLFTVTAEKVQFSMARPGNVSISIFNPQNDLLNYLKENPYHIESVMPIAYAEDDYSIVNGELLFTNNSYYYIYCRSDGVYFVDNLSFTIQTFNSSCYIPFPAIQMKFSPKYVDDIDKVFSNYTYDELKGFYSRFNQYVTLEDSLQEISIETLPWFVDSNSKYKLIVHLNFINKTVEVEENGVRNILYSK